MFIFVLILLFCKIRSVSGSDCYYVQECRREKVGIDVDEVLFPFVKHFCDFYNRVYKPQKNLTEYDFISYNFSDFINVPFEETFEIFDLFYQSWEFASQRPIHGSQEALKYLAKQYDLFVITSRPLFLETVTRFMLKKFFDGIFNDVFLGNEYGLTGQKKTKLSICKEHNINILIDDRIDNCNQIDSGGLLCFLFGNYAWNTNSENEVKINDGVVRITDWKMIQDLLPLPRSGTACSLWAAHKKIKNTLY